MIILIASHECCKYTIVAAKFVRPPICARMDIMNDEMLFVTDPQPSRADAVRNRALLLETAQKLFAEQGIETVSMTAIADAAGVGKGTLYRHFKSKMELCIALLDEDQRDLQERTLRHLPLIGAPCDGLRWFLQAVVDFVLRNSELLAVDMTDLSLQHPAHFWWRQTILGLLRQLAPDQDHSYTADVLYIMLDVRTISFQRHQLGYSPQRILDGLNALIEKLTR